MPKPIEARPSVIMNGETLNSATPTPLTMPIDSPARKPASMPPAIASHAMSGWAAKIVDMASAPTTEVTASMVPTDRSKPPVRSASICPIATRQRSVDRRLIEDEELHFARQCLGDHHLLLSAAGEMLEVEFEIEGPEIDPFGKLLRPLALLAAFEEDEIGKSRPVEGGERDVFARTPH